MEQRRENGRLQVLHACIECGKERWVHLKKGGVPVSQRCYSCGRDYFGRVRSVRQGAEHWHWKGGRKVMKNGYVSVYVGPDDPLAIMAHKNHVYEHRLVMAQRLRRPLTPDEVVHHVNGDKTDNRIANLRLLTRSSHNVMKLDGLHHALREAEHKAWKALGGYKFQMFGYWAAIWVHLNRIGDFHYPNPFKAVVEQAREQNAKGG